MKVLHISTSDISGGAARAAHRLHQGLQNVGVVSQMLVQTKESSDKTVLAPPPKFKKFAEFRKPLSKLPLRLSFIRESDEYSCLWLPDGVASKVRQLNPDVINLHWICDGYLNIETLAELNKPLVWTLHDMWAFTGGCHYNQDCDRYTNSCGACPQLQSNKAKDKDLSRWIWQRKAKAWKELDLTIVTPSAWLAKCASSSSLFKNLRVEVIPNGLDTKRYKPLNRESAREFLNLPQDKQLVLFGAVNATSSRRKGFPLLQSALKQLYESGLHNQIELIVFGSSQPDNHIDLGFKTHFLGRLSDDISLALVYAAADAFIAPSVQDNLPNTVMEALACGTPVVAFNIGGMPEMIEHEKNGYLAQPFEVQDLAKGIAWVLENKERHQKLCDRAHEKVEQEFSLELQAHRYTSLFTEAIRHKSKQLI